MAASNKTNIRAPGRTPPFILIGLLLFVVVLGYNYWSLWNTNADLSAELDVVRVQRKDGDRLIVDSEKNLAKTRGSLVEAQENLNQLKKLVLAKDAEISSVKAEMNNKQADIDRFKNEKGQCDSSLVQLKSELDALKSEKENLQKQLDEEKAKPVVCDLNSCKAPVSGVLTVVAKIVGSDPLSKALTEANFDAPALLEGIQFPVPQAPQKEQPQVKNDQPQAQKEQTENKEKGIQAENKKEEKKNEDIKTQSVDGRNFTDLQVNKNITVDGKSDEGDNETEISNQFTSTVNPHEEDHVIDEKVEKNANVTKFSKTDTKQVPQSDNNVEVENEEEGDKTNEDADADKQKERKDTQNN